MSVHQSLPIMSNGVKIDPSENTVTGVRKVRESGNSVVLTIPSEVLDAVGILPGDKVSISAKLNGEEVTIRPVEDDEE